jgi:signal transduction histidine kinase/ActR/RegA family two-component response regulator
MYNGPMKKTWISPLIIVLFFSGFPLYAEKPPLEDVSVQLKWFHQFQFAGIYMAKEKGYYKKHGLNVTIKERDPNKNNIMQVIDGEAEYGLADPAILRYRAEGLPVKVIAAIFQSNPMVLISKKESGIVSPFEMQGKIIAYQDGLDDSVISSLLTYAGLLEHEYIRRPMDFSHQDFIRGKVDISEAYISNEPYWMKKKYGLELNIIDPKTYGIDFYGDLLFTTEKEINEHPERVEAFKQATLKGWAYALDHREETIKVILDHYNTRALEHDQLAFEAKITANLIAAQYLPIGHVQAYRFERLVNIYDAKGLSRHRLEKALNTLIYNPHLQQTDYKPYIFPLVLIIVLLLSAVIFLFIYTKKLRQRVYDDKHAIVDALEQVQQAQDAKTTCLVNMSHEVRTPLNAILGFIEQLSKQEKDEHKLEMLTTIYSSGKNLLNIINDTMDVANIDDGSINLDLKPVVLASLCHEVESLLEGTCKSKNLSFRVSIENGVPSCAQIDEVRLQQVLINLLSNAIKFTHKGGSVSMDMIYNVQKETLDIFIIDTGIGISEPQLSQINALFSRTSKATMSDVDGTSLGLIISDQLIKLMNGSISLVSKLGEGSRFYLRLPYIPCENDTRLTHGESSLHLNGNILIVEDNKTNQILMKLILDQLGLEYEIANDGHEAITLFKRNNNYSLILMDENMPVMNGIEAVKQIREHEQSIEAKPIPIIAVTANALAHDKERFINAGMDDYIAKPYTEQSIQNVLIKYLQPIS